MILNRTLFSKSCVITLCVCVLFLFNSSQIAVALPISAEQSEEIALESASELFELESALARLALERPVLEQLGFIVDSCLPSSIQYVWEIDFDFDETFDGMLTVTISCTPDGSEVSVGIEQNVPCDPIGDIEIIEGELRLNGGHLECTFPAINPIVEKALENFDFILPEVIEYTDFVWWVDYEPLQTDSPLEELTVDKDVDKGEEIIIASPPDVTTESQHSDRGIFSPTYDLMANNAYLNNSYLNNAYLNNSYLNNAYLNNSYLNNGAGGGDITAVNSVDGSGTVAQFHMFDLLYADFSTLYSLSESAYQPPISSIVTITPPQETLPIVAHPSFQLGLGFDNDESITHIYTTFDEENSFLDLIPPDQFDTDQMLYYGGSLQHSFFAHAIENQYVGINQIDPLTFRYTLDENASFTIGRDSEGNVLTGTIDNLYIDPPVFITPD